MPLKATQKPGNAPKQQESSYTLKDLLRASGMDISALMEEAEHSDRWYPFVRGHFPGISNNNIKRIHGELMKGNPTSGGSQ